MSNSLVNTIFIFIIIVLIGFIIYERYIFRRGVEKNLKDITKEIQNIVDNNTDEKLMVFTANDEVLELLSQINRLLIKYQKIKVDFGKSEESIKKMLSNISHDIKTPVTVILGYLEIMRIKSPEDGNLIKLENKTKELVELINEFFNLAKLESNDMDMEIKKVNINEICRESILDFYNILDREEFFVDIDIPEEDIFVYGNNETINRILNNLISNVIRYGYDGKYLGIVLKKDKKFAYIDIVDKGMGIDKEFMENIFERLHTLDDSRNKRVQGNGLGLTIAKKLAENLGGDIFLESIPNIKTIFTLKLKRVNL